VCVDAIQFELFEDCPSDFCASEAHDVRAGAAIVEAAAPLFRLRAPQAFQVFGIYHVKLIPPSGIQHRLIAAPRTRAARPKAGRQQQASA
jgi:hypothetical protein